jgi:hypothetical protein
MPTRNFQKTRLQRMEDSIDAAEEEVVRIGDKWFPASAVENLSKGETEGPLVSYYGTNTDISVKPFDPEEESLEARKVGD